MAFSKNAEVQAAQSKLNSLESEVDRQTSNLLAEQQVTLTAYAKPIYNQIEKQKRLLKKILESTKVAETELSIIRADILLATDDQNRVLKETEIAQDNLVVIQKWQDVVDSHLEQVKSDQTAAERVVSNLQTEESRLLESISGREGQLASLEQQVVISTQAFDAAKTDREENLRQLDAKLLAVTTEIDQKLADEQLTRKSLAEWQTRLESQDQNLRVREMKVSEGETKIVRNSALLDL